ncbi:MAG: response regulator [Nitrospirae bacterium]|nr:response regulator [Nitrospirota bacterium]
MAAEGNDREYVPTVLVADDDPTVLSLMKDILSPLGHRVLAVQDGNEAIEKVRTDHPDLAILDIGMPGKDGLEVAQLIKDNPETRLLPVIIVTADPTARKKLQAIEEGADDFLRKPINVWELKARVRALLRLKRFTDELENAESVLMSLALSVEARDATTGDHCERLARDAVALGRWMGLPEADLKALHRGGYLHDVGKIGIPDAILGKPGRLTPSEWTIMRQHPVIGERLCKPMRSMRPVLPIIRHHHERWDGGGYPDGLAGEAIPLLARVLQTVDAFDALSHERPYKDALTRKKTFETLEDEVRKGWRDPKITEAFIEMKSHEARSAKRGWRTA